MRSVPILLLVVTLVPASANQGPAGDRALEAALASEAARPQQAPDVLSLLRSSLRAVASAQEAYWKEHQTYTTDLELLKQVPTGCEIAEGVTVRIVDASENGFATEATHPDFPERSCVQWYGKPGSVQPVATAREGKRGDESPGRVVCDAP